MICHALHYYTLCSGLKESPTGKRNGWPFTVARNQYLAPFLDILLCLCPTTCKLVAVNFWFSSYFQWSQEPMNPSVVSSLLLGQRQKSSGRPALDTPKVCGQAAKKIRKTKVAAVPSMLCVCVKIDSLVLCSIVSIHPPKEYEGWIISK